MDYKMNLLLLFELQPKEGGVSSFLGAISSYFGNSKGGGSIVIFLLIVIVFLLLAIFFYILEERKRRKKIEALLKKKYEEPKIKVDNEKRISKRTRIPEGVEVKVEFLDESERGLNGFMLDISRGGMAIEPNFPLRRLYVDQIINSIKVSYKDIVFIIRKARVIRISHHMNQRVIAFKFLDVDNEARGKILTLMSKFSQQ